MINEWGLRSFDKPVYLYDIADNYELSDFEPCMDIHIVIENNSALINKRHIGCLYVLKHFYVDSFKNTAR